MAALKLKYRCTGCNWKFSRNIRPNLCPYCGKMAVVEDTAQGAQELLHEIEEAERSFQARQ